MSTNDRYAGIWLRLSAIVVDSVVLLPAWFFVMFYPFTTRAEAAAAMVVLLFLTTVVYPIGCHTRWGQTIGKMFLKIKVTKTDFSEIDFREALLRSSVDAVFTVVYSFIQVRVIYSISGAQFRQLDAVARAALISGATPQTLRLLSYTWMIGGISVILINKRKRALRDMIGETVLVKV